MVFLVIGIVAILIIWLMDKFLKPKWIKYVFVLFLLILTIYFVVIAKKGNGEGFEDLANFLLALFTFIGTISSLITAIILDIVRKTKSKNIRKSKK